MEEKHAEHIFRSLVIAYGKAALDVSTVTLLDSIFNGSLGENQNTDPCERCYVGRSFTVENEVKDKYLEAIITANRIIIIAKAL